MAKSLRSKVKRSFRAKKREEGVYAVSAAARLQRLNSKLLEIAKKDVERDPQDEEEGDVPGWLINALAFMPNVHSLQPQDLAGLCSPTSPPTHRFPLAVL
ncbi:hypothetical protein FA15DRAFT_238595 [Coprinopsis marcescibilis]|uniref:DUF2423 domain-containing protein n=1 Tax=Coprinopsis marcescibilis TaxID=230819 RepID=A0A5C3L2L9_COPMA|nr:hypothetical protein FA15DRAFT_238595 [Coprinopsis marcescibilis]